MHRSQPSRECEERSLPHALLPTSSTAVLKSLIPGTNRNLSGVSDRVHIVEQSDMGANRFQLVFPQAAQLFHAEAARRTRFPKTSGNRIPVVISAVHVLAAIGEASPPVPRG